METNNRPKILCLGISFVDIRAELNKHDLTPEYLNCDASNPNCAIKAVELQILSQMDGRDLARCLATENFCNADVFTVSQEKGAIYRKDRHFDGNFNRPRFVDSVRRHFGNCQFDSIILDYFWIPPGWDASHWTQTFFNNTLVSFAKQNLLNIRTEKGQPYYGGNVFLPFCLHCFREIIASFDKLKYYYNISFVRKSELIRNALWAGTHCIDATLLQTILGKRADQEEIYCKYDSLRINEVMEERVTKETLLKYAKGLQNIQDIRFIILQPLLQKEPLEKGRNTKPILGRFFGMDNSLRNKRKR